jgi:hypothetical protein
VDLDVVALARVEVDVERAVRREHAPGVGQARGEEGDVVVERVGVGERAELVGAVAAAREAGAVAVDVGDDLQRAPPLHAPGVERRIDVDDVEGVVGQAREDGEVVAVDEEVVVERDAGREVGGGGDAHGAGR